VTIASQNASTPAVLTGLTLSSSNGLTFSNLDFKVSTYAGAPAPFVVGGSQDVHFTGIYVHGSLDGNPGNDGAGLLIRSSSNVSVEDSEFEQLSSALGHLNNSYITFAGNAFHDIRSDGILGGGSSNMLIQGNYFTDFYPSATDHADAIQFWTTNTTSSAHDIQIRENVLMRGDGQSNVQGIFVGDEVGTLPYQRLTIADNLIVGGGYNGIAIGHATSLTVTGNTVSGFTDYQSWIRLLNVNGATVTGNAANSFIIDSSVTNATVSGNITIARVTDGGTALYNAWKAEYGDTASSPTEPTSPTDGGTTGTASNDVLTGTSGANSLSGMAGNDTLSGLDGADTLSGGDGADRLDGGAGVDRLDGGAGSDSYIVTAGDTVVESVSGSAGGVDSVYSYANFTLGANVENLRFGGAGNLKGIGNDLGNLMQGNGANDWLEGRAGADTISSSIGADTLVGGTGNDLLAGGSGADRFVFAKGDGDDKIQDFGLGGAHDVLDLSALYNAGLKATLVDSAAGVTLNFSSGDSILLLGVHVSSLHATTTGYVF